MTYDSRWLYDEFTQVGTDYGSETEVGLYDARHADFRDVAAECRHLLDRLEIRPTDTLIDFGCGTGTFAIQAAQRCARVHAVDVSQTMIDYAAAKAKQADLRNISFHHAGFLTYRHAGPPVDAVVTTFAFHHLPDFWKGIALQRIGTMMKPGGQFYLHDVSMEEANALANIAAFIDKLAAAGGELLREDCERHFKEEYSTYVWIMDELLTRAGFSIRRKQVEDGVLGTYLCIKR